MPHRLYEVVAARARRRCEYCRAPEVVFNLEFEVDHVIPTSLGGSDDVDNLALACRSCNVRKGKAEHARDPDTKVLQAYAAYGEKMLYGKTTVGVIRSTFLIDADGKIEKAYYNVKATGHVARLRKDLGL